jgi:hypothetical protein
MGELAYTSYGTARREVIDVIKDVKVGDMVTRMLGDQVPMMLMKVSAVTDARIICALWEFDRATGAEVDEDLDWGPPPKMTGTYIIEGEHIKEK